MQVQVNTSNGIENTESLEQWATTYLNESLSRFDQDVTRIEVQLTDENQAAKKGSGDKRCMLEARVTGHPPIAVSHNAESQDLALRGASQRLVHALDHALGKKDRHQQRQRETIRKDLSVLADDAAA